MGPLGQSLAQYLELFGDRFGESHFALGGQRGSLGRLDLLGSQLSTDLRDLRRLIGWAKPADLALGFFRGTLLVERYQPHQQLLLGPGLIGRHFRQRRGRSRAAYQLVGEVLPIVSLEDGAIELVVVLEEGADQALLVGGLLLVGQRLTGP